MNVKHLQAIAVKEFFHVLRDPGTLLLVLVGPVFLMLVFTYTMTSDVEDASVAVIDQAQNEASRELIARIDESEVTEVADQLVSETEANERFERNEIVAAILIPPGYGEFGTSMSLTTMLDGSVPQVKAIIDGTEPVSAEEVLETVYRISDEFMRELGAEALAEREVSLKQDPFAPPIVIEQETLFNPGLRSVIDIYPGIAAMVLTLPAIALAMSLARENEAGTLEQLVATPIDKRAMLVGKMVPYLAFGMLDVYVLLALGRVLYDVPFEGSVLAYSFIAFLFVMGNLGVSLIIAVLIRSQQLAMIVAFLVFFVPPFFLSGLFFPQEAMPWIVRIEMIEFPATHYVTASKAIQLQGTSIIELWFPTLILVILAVEILEIAVFIFRKKVIITFSFKKLLGRGEAS